MGNGLAGAAKRLVREHYGVWPLFEWRNRLILGRRVPSLIAFENSEVARLSRELGVAPSAKVAVVVPTYKRPQMLIEALNSILAQTFQDYVIIVVDDGAGLPELPRDPRLFAVSLSRNSAVLGLVRNTGIRLTRSQYVAFLDDDNVWTPEHLAITVGALDDGADFVYTAVRRWTPDGKERDILSHPFDRKSFNVMTNYIDSNSIVVRRTRKTIFSRLPRGKSTHPKEDWEFAARQTRGARVVHIEVPTVEYLVNLESYYTTWTNPHGAHASSAP